MAVVSVLLIATGVLYLVAWLTGSRGWLTVALTVGTVAVGTGVLPPAIAIAFVLWEDHVKK